jgi:RNA polymerase sigma factor (TIGR02999 family)
VAEADSDVTDLLLRWNSGDKAALDALTPILYQDLKRLAGDLLRRERPGHTLSATALVHEIYLRLIDQRRVRWENRVHFFGAAARIMRRVLVDHARARTALKRGGSAVKSAIEEDSAVVGGLPEDIVDLDAALDALAAIDERKARVVEMKYFAGMTNQETAAALAVSDATVERDWKLARAWLIKTLRGTDGRAQVNHDDS